jgi:hypothetical protein
MMFLKNHCWVPGAYWQFIPPSCFSQQKRQKLYQHFPEAHDFMKTAKFNLRDVNLDFLLVLSPLRQKYIQLAGPDWMTYDEFCMRYLRKENVLDFFNKTIDKKLVQAFLSDHLNVAIKFILLANRDGQHMNKQINQQLADYFYQQSLTIKPLLY